jgi:hypothetical protein
MMKDKSEVFDIVPNCILEIKTQFSTIVQIVRSDNGLELMNARTDVFFQSLGIVHQTTCVHTSQQNRVAERKLRHLLDVARSIMFHMNVPS